MEKAEAPHTAYRYTDGGWESISLSPPTEASFRLLVNGRELITVLCTPEKLDCLAAGYLYTDGYIESVREIEHIGVDMEKREVSVLLPERKLLRPKRRIRTSGFGNGTISSDELSGSRSTSRLSLNPEGIIALMEEMKGLGALYKRSGGVHSSALCADRRILVRAEDVGRHNTMDKVVGEYLLRGLTDKIDLMLTTGRMSSEMVIKTARMGISVIASLSTPTSKAVELAERCGIVTLGYVGRDGVTVYSSFDRVSGN